MRTWLAIIGLLMLAVSAQAGAPEQRFPAPEFRTDYQIPAEKYPAAAAPWREWVDVGLLAGALLLATWLVYRRRSRRAVFWLTLGCLVYFGFIREGCICPIGSVGNLAWAAGGNDYALPATVAVIFALPLLFSLFAGRVFCSGVCPLGAIQDMVSLRPVRVPSWLEAALGVLAWFYLALAVLVAWAGSDLLICRYDPFVGFFRFNAPLSMLMLGGAILLASVFVGRFYCRFLCPYGALLGVFSVFSERRVTVTPRHCIDCRLCEHACPFGAIRVSSTHEEPEPRPAARRRVGWALLLAPLLIGGGIGVMALCATGLSRLDVRVQWADLVRAEEAGLAHVGQDELRAMRDHNLSSSKIVHAAQQVQARYLGGALVAGAFIGLVLAVKVLRAALLRRQADYTADPAMCVACARCYKACPVK